LLRRQGLRNFQGHSNYWIGLEDEKYDKVKRIWNRLSQEIDRLYNQVLEKKPEANDNDYGFDTGLLNQYMDAFSDEIRNLE
jgi:hypothetical protein